MGKRGKTRDSRRPSDESPSTVEQPPAVLTGESPAGTDDSGSPNVNAREVSRDSGGFGGDDEPLLAPPQSRSTPSAPRRGQPPMRRAQALAQLRRGGPAALADAPADLQKAAHAEVNEEAGAVTVPASVVAHAEGGHPSRSVSSTTADDGACSNDDGNRVAKPLQREDSAASDSGGGSTRKPHGRGHPHHARYTVEDEGEDDVVATAVGPRKSKTAFASSGDDNHEDDGGEDALAPAASLSKARESTVTLPTAPHGAAAATPYEAEDANALPRMLRLQRTFESNMRAAYDFCSTQVTEWPALALEWIPDRKFDDPERDYSLQYLAVGTQTVKGAPNQVRVMEVAVPHNADHEAMYGLYGDDDFGIEGQQHEAGRVINPATGEEIDAGKQFKNVRGHFRCEQAITLDSTVLKIRAMPAETNIIAVTTGSGFIGVFNLVQDQHDNPDGTTVPDALLEGHRMGGFGLSWNIPKPGYIASGADDGYVNYWDIKHRITVDLRDASDGSGGAAGGAANGPEAGGMECQPIQKLTGHRDIITDVSWHATQGHLLASSSNDGDVRVWDIRTSGGKSVTVHGAHVGGATAAQFHPVGVYQLATAGAGGELCFWDIRRPKDPLLELAYHGRAVTGLQWAPFSETVIASFGEDGRVVIWDLAKTSLPLAYSEDALAPPEVSFVHMGHMGVVTDVSWSSSRGDDWLMASADSLNGVHVYRPKEAVVKDYQPRDV